MKKNYLLFLFALLSAGCRHDEHFSAATYPPEVDRIISNNCATSGCHNEASKDAAAGLDFTTWESMQAGAYNGAVLIPFRPDYSTMLYFTNVDSSLGIVQSPTMPINQTPLSKSDYLALRNWIISGAPNSQGEVMFPIDANRRKFYVISQGCDVVHVFDAEKKVAIRAIDVGVIPGAAPPESPHVIRVTPDGKYWMVAFLNTDILQVFDANTDVLLRNIDIGNGIAGQWNTLHITSDSKTAYSVDYGGGRIAIVDLENGTSNTIGPFPITGSASPELHGLSLNQTEDTMYVTCIGLSKILKIPVNDISSYQDIKLYKIGQAPTTALRPHQIEFSPDYKKYFVTCQDTNHNEVRVMDTNTDTLIKIIPVGRYPQEMSLSPSKGLLFVTNMEDNYFADMRGSVSVIDLQTLTEIKRIKVGWQPHGICVDEASGLVYVPNRNVSQGVAPHHASACGGANGNMSVIDLNTLETLSNYKPELSVDPYSVWVKP